MISLGLIAVAATPVCSPTPSGAKNTGAAVKVLVVGDHKAAPTLPLPTNIGVDATSVAVAIGEPVAAAAPALAVYAHSKAPGGPVRLRLRTDCYLVCCIVTHD